jgi:hypothetical protein
VSDRLGGIRSFLDKWSECSLRLSHTSAVLTGLVDEFAEAEVTSQTTGAQLCIARQAEILDQIDSPYRVRALDGFVPEGEAPASSAENVATHLLFGDLALPLSQPVSVSIGDHGLQMSSEIDEGAALTVVMRNGALETLRGGGDASLPENCRPGESLRVGDHELRLIRVGQA